MTDHITDLVVLVGFRGVGKTTIGRMLAGELGYAFIDTDAEIENRNGREIADIVAAQGWQGFRACEQEVLETVARLRETVVATGGGAVLHEQLWPLLRRRARVIWLTAEEEVILTRLARDERTLAQRPSLTGAGALAEIGELLRARLPLYARVAHDKVDTTELAAAEVTRAIRRLLEG